LYICQYGWSTLAPRIPIVTRGQRTTEDHEGYKDLSSLSPTAESQLPHSFPFTVQRNMPFSVTLNFRGDASLLEKTDLLLTFDKQGMTGMYSIYNPVVWRCINFAYNMNY